MKNNTDKKHAIMQATLELVANNGFHNCPTSMIAKHANTAEGTIFRHFKNKEELIHTVFEDLLTNVKQTISQGLSELDTFREQFIQLGVNIMEYFKDNPTEYLYLEQYLGSSFGEAARNQWLDTKTQHDEKLHPVIGMLKRGREQKVLKDLPNVSLAALFLGPIDFLLQEIIRGQKPISRPTFQGVIEACWDGIKNQ